MRCGVLSPRLVSLSVFAGGQPGLQLEGAGEGGKGIEPGVRRDFGDAPVRGHQQLLRVKDAKAGQIGDKAAAVLLGERVAEIGWGEIKLPGNVAQRNRLAEVGGDTISPARMSTLRSRWRRGPRPFTAWGSGLSMRSASTTPCRRRIFTSGQRSASISSGITMRAGQTATAITSAIGRFGTRRTSTQTTARKSGPGAGRRSSTSSFTRLPPSTSRRASRSCASAVPPWRTASTIGQSAFFRMWSGPGRRWISSPGISTARRRRR